jgi:hypothetical protein
MSETGKTTDEDVLALMKELSLYGNRHPMSNESRLSMRKKIWSMIVAFGLTAIWFTLNPNDINNPVKLKLAAHRERARSHCFCDILEGTDYELHIYGLAVCSMQLLAIVSYCGLAASWRASLAATLATDSAASWSSSKSGSRTSNPSIMRALARGAAIPGFHSVWKQLHQPHKWHQGQESYLTISGGNRLWMEVEAGSWGSSRLL